MISSNTDLHVQRKLTEILRIIKENDSAIGARLIADKMRERGYQIGERGVRYHLRILDERGLTVRDGYHGRNITERGLKELEDGLINQRVGFITTSIDEFIYRTDIDVNTGKGKVIVNTAFINQNDLDKSLDIIDRINKSPYSISPHVGIIKDDSKGIRMQEGKVCIATVCSITIDGILVKNGIPVDTKYGGLIQIRAGIPSGFSDLVSYGGTTIDPMRIFINNKMTSVLNTLEKGNGMILGNIREIPVSAKDYAFEVLEKARKIDINGLIQMGEPNSPVLGAPINPGKIGIPIYAGINSLVAVAESGIEIDIHPISTIMNYQDMIRF